MLLKKGAAGIIVIVLVILITLVATGTVWVVVKGQLNSGTENFKTSDCFAVDLSVTSCIYDSNNVAVLIKRGSNQIEISNAKLIFDNQGSPSIIEINNTLPQPLGARQFIFTRTQIPHPSTVTVAAILGGTIVCSPSNKKVACTTSPNAIANNNNNTNNTSSTAWNKLNGGNPIDGGESFTPNRYIASTEQVTTVKDSSGNLIYTFPGDGTLANPANSIYMGRISSVKSWDLLTFNGWSRSTADVPKPFSQNRFVISKLKMFNTAQNNVIGTFAASPGVTGQKLDIHDRAYSFVFDSDNSRYWSSSSGYNNNSITPLTATIFGTQSYSHDSDKNNDIILSVSTAYHGKRILTAARYKNSLWENWQNNAWTQPTNLVYAENNLNVLALPFSNQTEDNAPIVTSIPGTQEFMITYYSKNSQAVTSLKAAKYNDTSNSWSWWNNGWQTNVAVVPQELATGFTTGVNSDVDNQRFAFVQNNIFYTLYLKYDGQITPTLQLISYNLTSQLWSNEIALFPARDLLVSKNESGDIWIAYSNSSSIMLSQFSNGLLFAPEEVYQIGASNTKLMGLDFLNTNPVIFIGQGSSNSLRIYALGNTGSGYWNDEQIRTPVSQNQPTVLNINYGQEKGQFDTEVWENISYNNFDYIMQSSYGPQICGHMTLDSENNIYCPKILVNGLGIFPENYTPPFTLQNETAHHWGGWWDYLYFPSGVAVDNVRGKVYITDNIAEGSELDGNITGNLQVWEKSWNDENVIRDILNGSNNPVVVIDPLQWVPQVYTQAEAGHNLDWPSDVALNEQRALLYVTETNSNRVVVYNVSTGTPVFLKAFGSEGNGPNEFDHPEGIDTDSIGNVYVVDSRNNRIKKFDYDGNFITQWGNTGRGNGEFIYPYALSVDKIKKYVYVTDTENHRVQIFNQSGNFVYAFGQWSPEPPANAASAYRLNKIGGVVANNNALFISTNNNNSADISPGVIVKFQMNLP